jgi:hypothetical protein
MMTRRTALVLAGGLATRADEWIPLFDGKSFAGWTLGDGTEVTHSWAIEDGAIATLAGTRGRSDLLCAKAFRSFELAFEFRLSEGSNTGVEYFVQQTLRYLYPGSSLAGAYGAIGLEFQLADDGSPEPGRPNRNWVRSTASCPSKRSQPIELASGPRRGWSAARPVVNIGSTASACLRTIPRLKSCAGNYSGSPRTTGTPSWALRRPR